MKALPSGMQADLNSGATTHCHCWKLVRNDGEVLGFTDHDNNLAFDSITFEAATGFTASSVQQNIGLSVDNMDISGALVSDSLTDSDLAAGLWDNAEITLYRIDWSDVTKRVILMKGSIGEVSRGNLYFSAEMRSLAHALNQTTGRVYTAQCDAALFDGRCKLSSSGYSNSGTVSAVSSDRTFFTTTSGVLARENNFFNRGKVTWTSGNNNGFSMEVKLHLLQTSNVQITLWELMPFAIETGDTFTIQAGCDKSVETCKAKFNNVVNFRGFPRIPGNDATQYYAKKGANNNGGSLWS